MKYASQLISLAACFGSVRAVTFIAAQGYLENEQISSSGFMVAVMALMEVPAIIIALFLYEKYEHSPAPAAIRTAIPGANPSLYVALPLALTFPMNVLIGIPLYAELSRALIAF